MLRSAEGRTFDHSRSVPKDGKDTRTTRFKLHANAGEERSRRVTISMFEAMLEALAEMVERGAVPPPPHPSPRT